MEENENVIEGLKKLYPSDKKKKKFVYLDKYDAYKESTDARLHLLERSINGCYISLAILTTLLVIVIITK